VYGVSSTREEGATGFSTPAHALLISSLPIAEMLSVCC